MTIDDALIRASEAAQILGISKTTLWRMTKEKSINAYKIGSQLRYRRGDLAVYLQRNCTLRSARMNVLVQNLLDREREIDRMVIEAMQRQANGVAVAGEAGTSTATEGAAE